jgi:acyl-CoA thioesterase-1
MAAALFASAGLAHAQPLRVVAFGDSLTAGAGVAAEASLPALLQQRLLADGFDVEVVNAGVSGDTTTAGLARLDYALADGADLVLLELGANDMLLGVDPKITRENLDKMIAQIQARGVRVLLAKMVSSSNFGKDYKREFDAIYPDLARRRGVSLTPFIMEGVWGDKSLLVADGIHPNPAGVAHIVSKIAPSVEKTLAALSAKRASGTQ